MLLAGYDPDKHGRDVRTDEEHSRRVQENGAGRELAGVEGVENRADALKKAWNVPDPK